MKRQSCPHIEDSQFDQVTGAYMIATLAFNEVKQQRLKIDVCHIREIARDTIKQCSANTQFQGCFIKGPSSVATLISVLKEKEACSKTMKNTGIKK